jgi:DNA-binding CsgD family transcriptional regulator
LDDYRKHVTNPIDLLTSREREVLQMLAEGKTNKEIAVVLNLSVYTVDAHRGRIMEKLNLHSINELVRFALRNGLNRLTIPHGKCWSLGGWIAETHGGKGPKQKGSKKPRRFSFDALA